MNETNCITLITGMISSVHGGSSALQHFFLHALIIQTDHVHSHLHKLNLHRNVYQAPVVVSLIIKYG